MRALCTEHHLTDDPEVLASGNLMHSLAGAWVAQHEYGVTDKAVLQAVSCHTMGQPGMSSFDMVIFIADKIEPTRRPFPSLIAMRDAAGHSLAKAMIASIEGTVQYVDGRGAVMHPLTMDTLAWLKALPANR